MNASIRNMNQVVGARELSVTHSPEYLRHAELTKQVREAMGDRYIPWLRKLMTAPYDPNNFIAYSTVAHEKVLAELGGALVVSMPSIVPQETH